MQLSIGQKLQTVQGDTSRGQPSNIIILLSWVMLRHPDIASPLSARQHLPGHKERRSCSGVPLHVSLESINFPTLGIFANHCAFAAPPTNKRAKQGNMQEHACCRAKVIESVQVIPKCRHKAPVLASHGAMVKIHQMRLIVVAPL